ncbi:hypothetical protein F2Q69_00003308 [Brassica cretica]|uniref:Uncharacterized protein n=1 Tax=Brassica cretica TaxID=69181 RepID=A0A8S9PCY3_BRACR|nr:hypothetical protein F2Q69_00003308 [Brassica cretica]
MNSLKGGCSVESGFMGVSWQGWGATHEWILSILEVYDKGLIKAWLGGSWPFMIKKAHDPFRSYDIHWIVIHDGSWIDVGIDHDDAPVVRTRLIEFIGTWFHGRLVHERTWLQGSIRLRLDSTEPWPWPVQGYKRAVRVDGELVEATSQLYQLEESDGTSSEVVVIRPKDKRVMV